MKGLQQAVNIKLWPGNGEPAKAWGKLKQDPELWDERGDTLIFLSRDRSNPSFRISSTLLRDTGSDTMMDMLLYGTVRSGPSTRGVSHKIYMDPPSSARGEIDILRHHITTRNIIAFLLGKALVGFTFYQAIIDLHERLEDYLAPLMDCEASLKAFLVSTGLVNVSNEPRAAAGLLAWSEDTRWKEGWREAFVHAVGMYQQIKPLQESANISLATQAHLENAHLELQVRIQEAEHSLTTFYFDDAHFAQEDEPSTVRAASLRFRKFLKQYYEQEYQAWPVRSNSQGGIWLDRRITSRLQQDFAALYEYCVDRDVRWVDSDGTDDEQSYGRNKTPRKKKLLKSNTSSSFWLDAEDDRMLGVFQTFECRLNTSSIPHPYPILPASIPGPSPALKKSVFSKSNKKDKIRESRIMHAYAAASNASQWSREFALNNLARAFSAFEKADTLDSVDPREARRERWIIIYCVLQALACISVDVPHLSFKGDVDYFLNARLERLPPWSPDERIYMEASREQSHCWIAAKKWADTRYEQHTSIKQPDRSDSLPHSGIGLDNRLRSPESHCSSSPCRALLPEPQASTFPFLDGNHSKPSLGQGRDDDYPSDFDFPRLASSNKTAMMTTPSLFSPSLTEGSSHNDRSTLSSEPSRDCDRPIPSKAAKMAGISEYSTKPLALSPSPRSKGENSAFPMPRR